MTATLARRAPKISRPTMIAATPTERSSVGDNSPATKPAVAPRLHASQGPDFPPTSLDASPNLRASAGTDSPAPIAGPTPRVVAGHGSDIRAWARANGYTVGARGRIPAAVTAAYHQNNPAATCGPSPRVTARRGASSQPPQAASTPMVGSSAGVDTPATNDVATPRRRTSRGADRPAAAANFPANPMAPPPLLLDAHLNLAAEAVDDIERTRIANVNRLRQALRGGPDYRTVFPNAKDDGKADKDGERRGFGLPIDHPDVAALLGVCEALGGPKLDGSGGLEHNVVLGLERNVRKHPLYPWAKAHKGIGPKQFARLLAAIGDPYYNTLHDRPRKVSELIAYCGYDPRPVGQVPGARAAVHRRKGQQVNWNTAARMRTYVIAESCIKQTARGGRPAGYYRTVYDAGRAKYADAVHASECVRCGPKGKPAPVGSPLSDGHKHMRAMRLVSKEILKDLWRESKRLHDTAA